MMQNQPINFLCGFYEHHLLVNMLLLQYFRRDGLPSIFFLTHRPYWSLFLQVNIDSEPDACYIKTLWPQRNGHFFAI